MSDAEDIDDIREQKREELMNEAGSPDEPVHVQGADHLQEVLGEHHVVLLDFYADWCGPCQMLEPIVEALAAETAATVGKVDIDANQALAQQYQVQGVPTLYLVVDGEPVERIVGMTEKAELQRLIEQYA